MALAWRRLFHAGVGWIWCGALGLQGWPGEAEPSRYGQQVGHGHVGDTFFGAKSSGNGTVGRRE